MKEEELREKKGLKNDRSKNGIERLRLEQQKEQFVQSNIENFEYIFDSILENSNIEEALRVGSMIIWRPLNSKMMQPLRNGRNNYSIQK